MLKFIKKCLCRKKKFSRKGKNSEKNQASFLREFMTLLDYYEMHPVTVFTLLIQFLANISGDISLNEECTSLDQEDYIINDFIKKTHKDLTKKVNQLRKIMIKCNYTASKTIH